MQHSNSSQPWLSLPGGGEGKGETARPNRGRGVKVKCRRGGEKAEKCESGEVRFACVWLLDFC